MPTKCIRHCRLVPLVKKAKPNEETRKENVVSITTSGTIPDDISASITTLIIDADISGGDLILTGWTPTSIKEGTIVQLRKTDNSANKIVFNDGGIEYTFCEARGEFVKLIWTNSGFKIT